MSRSLHCLYDSETTVCFIYIYVYIYMYPYCGNFMALVTRAPVWPWGRADPRQPGPGPRPRRRPGSPRKASVKGRDPFKGPPLKGGYEAMGAQGTSDLLGGRCRYMSIWIDIEMDVYLGGQGTSQVVKKRGPTSKEMSTLLRGHSLRVKKLLINSSALKAQLIGGQGTYHLLGNSTYQPHISLTSRPIMNGGSCG